MKLLSSPTKPPASLPLSSRPSTRSERRAAGVGRAHFGQHLDAGAPQLADVAGARGQGLEVEDQPAEAARDERQERLGLARFEAIELQAEGAASVGGENVELAQDRAEVAVKFAH